MSNRAICAVCNTRLTPYPAARNCRECDAAPPTVKPSGELWTRAEYLNGACRHRDYYGQFVTDYVKSRLLSFISKNWLLNSTDRSFNDIPLRLWDNLPLIPTSIGARMKEAGDYLTLAGKSCIYKEAAQQVVDAEHALAGS